MLIYLNDVQAGGHTTFAKLGLSVQPVKGDAIVFFPARLDGALDASAAHSAPPSRMRLRSPLSPSPSGTLDEQYLHAAEPAVDPKWVSQIWIRQRAYNGLASVRIPPV